MTHTARQPTYTAHGVPLHERWTPKRKAEAVAAIHAGRFTRDQLRQAIDGRSLSPRHGENG